MGFQVGPCDSGDWVVEGRRREVARQRLDVRDVAGLGFSGREKPGKSRRCGYAAMLHGFDDLCIFGLHLHPLATHFLIKQFSRIVGMFAIRAQQGSKPSRQRL